MVIGRRLIRLTGNEMGDNLEICESSEEICLYAVSKDEVSLRDASEAS